MIRFNNLKKLHKLVIRYYEEIMGQDIECIPVVNLNAIAKDADAKDLLRLCQLVVALAVQSENNNMYIEMIQSLTQKSQHALMVSIEEIMSQINDVDGRAAGESGEFESGFSSPNGSLQYQAEFEKLLGERKTLEKSHKHLVEKYDDLRSRYEELEADKEDLKSRLLDMDAAVTQANDTGKADFIMRTEIEHLKQDLLRSEDRRQETELVIEKQNRKIAENERKIEDLSKTAEQVQYLNDQLEEYKHTEEKLHKMENAIEKYKKRLEDGADLRRQIKALEEQNATLMERNHQVEDEYRKVLAFKTLMDSYKEQVHNLENDKAEILIEKHKIEEALRKAEERCNMLEQDKARDQDQIHSLEDQLAELELGGGSQSMGSITDQQNVATMNTVVDTPNMEEDLQKANVAEMQLTIKRLEEQIVHLQANASDVKNEQLDALQAKIEASSAGERQWQQKHADLESRYQLLEKDILQIREGIPDTLPKQMQAIKTFRARIIDLEKEGKYLSESTSAFEKRVTEATRAISKDGATLDAFEKEYAVQQERINRLEDITKIQLHDINRLLIEANYLNGINNKSGSNLDDAPGMSDKELENLKERNATLQIQVLHLQEELNETQSKIRRAREMIKLYSKLFKESLVTNVRPHDLSYMQKVPRTREEENELLKRQIHDVRLQSRKEQQLIISSWYELARREKRDSASLSGRPTSSSWLGRQRKILENQLKKR
ncbi:hypothetical protein VKS41_003772 [Umbelopsis sp. WA50703]